MKYKYITDPRPSLEKARKKNLEKVRAEEKAKRKKALKIIKPSK